MKRVELRIERDVSTAASGARAPSRELEYATQLKLVNHPDAYGLRSSQLVPEAATGFPVFTYSNIYGNNLAAACVK